MASTDYATIDELKERTSIKTTDDTSDGLIQQMLDAAAEMVDNYTRGFMPGVPAFSASASATRYFSDDPRQGWLEIDDALTITAVAISGATALDASYWQAFPYNVAPKTRIEFNAGADRGYYSSPGWYAYPYPYRAARQVAVTGTWGYCSAATRPAAVREATLVLAERMYERSTLDPKSVLGVITGRAIPRMSYGDIASNIGGIIGHLCKATVWLI